MYEMKEYRDSYDGLSYTPDQKARIAASSAAAAKATLRKPRRNYHVFSKMAAVAACLVCVLTITAEAAGISTPVSELLAPIFGGTVAQTEVIDKIGHPIDANDTDNGVTISADAIIGDKYNTAILFSISREDGSPVLPEGMTVNQLMLGGWGSISQQEGGSHGSSRFLDVDPEDNSIQFLMLRSYDMAVKEEPVIVQFTDLRYWNEETQTAEILIEGRWSFRFEMDYEDTSVVLGNREVFRQDDMEFTITEIQVSPIAVRVAYEVASEVQWSDAPSGRLPEEDRRQQERYMENVEILLIKNDGTTLDMSNAGGSIQPENGKTYCVKGEILSEIVPLEELASIRVGGVEYVIE